jgi:exopolysaccharide production protein ExoY
MLKEKGKAFNELSRVADLGLITASFVVAATFSERMHGIEPLAWIPRFGGSADPDASKEYALLFLIGLVSWLAVSQWRATYRSHRTDRVWNLLRTHTSTQLIWAMLTATGAFLFKLHYLSRTFFFMFLPLSMALMSIRQTGSMVLLHFLRTRGFNLRAVLVVGDAAQARRFAEIIRKKPTTGYQIIAQVSGDVAADGQFPDSEFDEVFVLAGESDGRLEGVLLKLAMTGKQVHLVPAIFDATLFKTSLDDFAGVPIVSIGGFGLSRLQHLAKRLVDVAGSIVLLILLSPVLILAGLFVKLRSRGPVFFAQDRLGENGRQFRIYKFRTMLRDAEERLLADPVLYQKYVENNFKLPKGEDPRIAPGGNFLRSTSIDELPQLFNVLKGDMSLVGPRPIVPSEIRVYGEYGPLFLSVKPGLTGYWQINGRSEVRDYSRRTAFDIEYIRDQSFKTDVDILLRTIPAVLRRKGAH